MYSPSRSLRSAVDIVNSNHISGWVTPKQPVGSGSPVTVEVALDGHPLGEVVAEEPRPDLFQLQLHPTGRCGFTFLFPPGFAPGEHRRLTLNGRGARFFTMKTEEIPQVFPRPPKLFFMHIPKTAGSSFCNFLSSRYPAGAVSERLEALDRIYWPQTARDKSCLAGHMSFGEFQRSFDMKRYSLYTILRDPWRQLHSHLNWVRAVGCGGSGFYQAHPECVQNMADRLDHAARHRGGMVTELKRLVAELEGFEADFFDNLQTRYFLDTRPHRVGPLDLENALHNSRAFTEIGTTEQYREFTMRFCSRHGLPWLEQKKALNKTKVAPLYDVDSEAMKKILYPLVEYDLQLYAAVTSPER